MHVITFSFSFAALELLYLSPEPENSVCHSSPINTCVSISAGAVEAMARSEQDVS